MRYIHFLKVLFCLLLNVFTLYPSENKATAADDRQKLDFVLHLDKDPTIPEGYSDYKNELRRRDRERRSKVVLALLAHSNAKLIANLISDYSVNPAKSEELIRDAFYNCSTNPKGNQEALRTLFPEIKPPFRDDFLSKMKKKPLPMEKIIAQTKITIAGRPIFTGQPNPTWKILTNLDMYRSDNENDDKKFTFTLDKVRKFTDEVAPNGNLLSLSELSDEQFKYCEDPPMLHRSSAAWHNTLTWTCVNPLSKKQRLAIVDFFLGKDVDNVAIKEALIVCRDNKSYNQPIIDILEKRLAQKSRDRDPDKL